MSGSPQGAGGVGGLLMIQEGGNSYLPAYDGNGNIHALIKASDGTLAAAYEYDAFGNTLRESGTYAASNPFRFSTKYTDIETGLVYYGLRYYSPTLGRFINQDPISESGGLNLYGFCSNNSVNSWDYLGMYVFAPRSGWNLFEEAGNTQGTTGGSAMGGIGWAYSTGLAVEVDEMDSLAYGIQRSSTNSGNWVQNMVARNEQTQIRDALVAEGATISVASSLSSSIMRQGWAATYYDAAEKYGGAGAGLAGEEGLYRVSRDPVTGGVTMNSTESVDTDYGYLNGILGDLERHAYLGFKHIDWQFGSGINEFTLYNNPTVSFWSDVLQTSADKLGITTAVATDFARVLQNVQNSGRNVTWIAHSQGGAIFAEAMRILREQGVTNISANSVVFHAGANNAGVTNRIAQGVGVRVGGYYYSPWDAVPVIIGANGTPAQVAGSLIAAPLLFSDEGRSPHTVPSGQWRLQHAGTPDP